MYFFLVYVLQRTRERDAASSLKIMSYQLSEEESSELTQALLMLGSLPPRKTAIESPTTVDQKELKVTVAVTTSTGKPKFHVKEDERLERDSTARSDRCANEGLDSDLASSYDCSEYVLSRLQAYAPFTAREEGLIKRAFEAGLKVGETKRKLSQFSSSETPGACCKKPLLIRLKKRTINPQIIKAPGAILRRDDSNHSNVAVLSPLTGDSFQNDESGDEDSLSPSIFDSLLTTTPLKDEEKAKPRHLASSFKFELSESNSSFNIK